MKELRDTMVQNLNVQSGPQIALIAVLAVLLPLVTIVVGVRFWSRRSKGVGLWLDDWAVAVSLVCIFERRPHSLELTN